MSRLTAVLSVDLEPRTATDMEKLVGGLRLLKVEDPTLRVRSNRHTGGLVLSGVGELQLAIVVDRLGRECDAQMSVGAPHVAYKETLARPVDGEWHRVKLVLSPGKPGSGYVFDNEVVVGSMLDEFIEAIEIGVREALIDCGPAGYPIDDVRIELHERAHHDVDSSQAAFKVAGGRAVRNALENAQSIVLEPVMRVELHVPNGDAREVLSLLEGRRAHTLSHDERDQTHAIVVRAPMSALLGFAEELRALTAGRGTFAMTFERYEPQRGAAGDDGTPIAVTPRRPPPRIDSAAIELPDVDDRS